MDKRNRGLSLVSITLVLMLVLVIVACTSQPAQDVQKQVKVGVLASFTGPIASTGVPATQGMIDAMEYINDNGGIDGVKVAVRWEETAHMTTRVITGYKRLVEWDAVAILTITAQAGEALLPRLQQDGIPLMYIGNITAPMTSNPMWNITGCSGWGPEVASLMKWVRDNWTEARPPR